MINIITAKAAAWAKADQQRGIEKTLLFSSVFGVGLLAIRIGGTGSLNFGFLPWNLFLAYIPYALTKWMSKKNEWAKRTLKFSGLFLLWLIFIPNSFYIITDLFHLDEGPAAPQWFNLVLIFSFAWNGLLLGIISLRQMEKLMEPLIPVAFRWIFLYAVLFLNALGIYIGRFLRYNSWDIMVNPFQLSRDIIALAFHPFRNLSEWAMIFCFTGLMFFVYQSIKKLTQVVF